MGYTAEAATSVEKSERVAASGGVRGDGYTELPNEATAVDFVQPLCRMRQWSCNRLPINNALVSGARAREEEEGEEVEAKKKRKKKKKKSRSEKWKDGGDEERGGETSATLRERRRSGVAFVLVDDVAGLVHYPCVILIVFTLRLIDAR